MKVTKRTPTVDRFPVPDHPREKRKVGVRLEDQRGVKANETCEI